MQQPPVTSPFMKWKDYERPVEKYSLCVNTTDTFIMYKHLYIYIYIYAK